MFSLIPVVYKKTFQPNGVEHKGIIKVIDSLAIGNKKHLLIVKIKNENFLIASGMEHTTFLAKLDSNLQPKTTQNEIIETKEISSSVIPYVGNVKIIDGSNDIKPNCNIIFPLYFCEKSHVS